MPLATRLVGRTTLTVQPGRGTLHRLLGRESDITGYTVTACANGSRDTAYLATFDTLARAVEYMEAYSPRYGLLRK